MWRERFGSSDVAAAVDGSSGAGPAVGDQSEGRACVRAGAQTWRAHLRGHQRGRGGRESGRWRTSFKSWCSLWKGGFGTNPPSGGPAESINKSTDLCIPFVHSICRADPLRPRARAPPPRCGRLQARRRTISPDAIDLHAPFAARLEALALRRRCARTPKSGQLVPALRPTDGAECARVLCRWCGGEGADAARRAAQPAPNVVPRPAA